METTFAQSLTAQLPPSADRPAARIKELAEAAKSGSGFDAEAARKAAEDFEAGFLATLFDTMFQGLKTDGPFGGGQGEEVFRSLLNQEYARAVVTQGGIGIAGKVFEELRRYQEGA